MAIGALTMLLANVGLQIYNNWCGSRQNSELQKKREEFERAARDRNTEHMWKLLREGQELTVQLENVKHQERLKELKDEVDHLLERLTYETTISNWPLRVLPIVMKNQAFGNLLANQEEHVAMHVVFTRSNYDKFNKLVYPIVEKELEQYFDKHWSMAADHPVLFYSGAWKPMSNPTDVQVSAMREELKNLPTLLITPFFRPGDGKLVFQFHMWGVGANSTDKFDVPEIEPIDFQRTFCNKDDYDNEEGLLEEIVEDIVPYLECLIGYMTDTYFWSSTGLSPHLPMLVTNGAINVDGMPYLVTTTREYYDNLLIISEENAKQNPLIKENLLNLYEGCVELWDDDKKKSILTSIISLYNDIYIGNHVSLKNALCGNDYHYQDLPFLINIRNYNAYLPSGTYDLLENEIARLNHLEPNLYSRESFPTYLLREVECDELDIENILHAFEKYCNEMNIEDISILIYYKDQNEYHFHTYDDEKDMILYYDTPFNICYKVQSVKHQRNVYGLFGASKTRQISCRLSRLEYLIERINSTTLNY